MPGRSSPKSDEEKPARLCFIDIETTGSVFGYHEILDIGVVRTERTGCDRTTVEWGTRLRPQYPDRITPVAAERNGYNDAEWKNAPFPSKELWSEFNEIVGGCVPVCHNPSFDRAFISLCAYACGIKELAVDYHWIGTESLAWPLYAGGWLPELSLSGMCRFFELPVEPRPHTALGGARACMGVYHKILDCYERGSFVVPSSK